MRGLLLILVAAGAFAQPARPVNKPKEKEPATQTLDATPEPPAAISAETGKLVFHVSPLSAQGLLTQQVRDALKALDRANNHATIVKLRAFVAGTGDMRRVATIVGEEFKSRKLPLPVVSTIQAGALPMEGAQVVIESVSMEKKVVNPGGLAFFPAESVARLRTAAESVGAEMLRVTCFLSSLDEMQAARGEITAAFPGAATDFVQLTRLGIEPVIACEAVGHMDTPRGPAPDVAQITGAKVVFTGTQMAFRDQDADLRLAYERLGKALESQGVHYRDVVFEDTYALSRSMEQKADALGVGFLNGARPASTSVVVEGLPSVDASVAIEVVASGN